MTKTIFEEMGGTYRQVGDYLLPNITVQTKETECIGLWGQRHARHLKEYHKVLYMNLLTSGKLYRYLVDVDRQAGDVSSTGKGICGQARSDGTVKGRKSPRMDRKNE